MAPTLDALLAGVEPSRVDTAHLEQLRGELDGRARGAVEALGEHERPLRLTKDRIARLLQCEHLALLTAGGRELTEPVVRGHVLDRLLHHHVHGGGRDASVPALAVAEGALAAERADDVSTWLAEHHDEHARLAEDATAFRAALASWGSAGADWWPRCGTASRRRR